MRWIKIKCVLFKVHVKYFPWNYIRLRFVVNLKMKPSLWSWNCCKNFLFQNHQVQIWRFCWNSQESKLFDLQIKEENLQIYSDLTEAFITNKIRFNFSGIRSTPEATNRLPERFIEPPSDVGDTFRQPVGPVEQSPVSGGSEHSSCYLTAATRVRWDTPTSCPSCV